MPSDKSLLPVLLVVVDEARCRSVVTSAVLQLVQLREDVLREDLAELRIGLCRRGHDEIGGDDLRAQVHKLVEQVLPARAHRAPDDRAGLVVDALAAVGDEHALGLHAALLEVRKQVIVGEEELRLRAVEVVVAEPYEREEDGEVLLERHSLEVLVHSVRATEQHLKGVVPDDERDREPIADQSE